jgi:hypothetical protein
MFMAYRNVFLKKRFKDEQPKYALNTKEAGWNWESK